MQTQGYERSAPWRQALALLTRIQSITADFEDDAFGLAGKLRSQAADLPARAALCFEQLDYDAAHQHAAATRDQLFKLWLTAQVAEHLGQLSHKQLNDLRKKLDALDDALESLPDELFEDDGQDTPLADAA